jgi:ApaG protein
MTRFPAVKKKPRYYPPIAAWNIGKAVWTAWGYSCAIALPLPPRRLKPHTMAEIRKYHITVTAKTHFIPEQSDEAAERYVFSYTITIANTGQIAAQLISRHWQITDAHQKVQEVRGLGVVGEQPLLKPGDSFEYTSGTAVATPVGAMKGSYQMVAEDGSPFEAEIPEFILSVPRVLH